VQKMSASAIELGFLDDFLGPRVLVFVNGFWGSSSLCRLKISASAVELGFEDIFGTAGTQFSSTVCLWGVVYLSRRCQRQP
jgi:ethanolamine utilization microcompartment shell protein EutS